MSRQHIDLRSAFVEHRPRLQRAAQRILGDSAGAEDVVQDAYLKAVESTGAGEVRQPLAFLIEVARNLAIDARRRGALEARFFATAEGAVDRPAPGTPETETMTRQNLHLVAQALQELPERTRRAFALYRLVGLTQSEVAHQLGVSTALVNSLVREAVACCAFALRRD
jgi:RNA polymerase sigma factor (sigma-70 family)